MAGFIPAIHTLRYGGKKDVDGGTSPAMTSQ
jgi:hypothetical protein